MIRWLARLVVTLFAVLIFALGCLLYWPAADWLPRLLPPQVTPVGLQGSLLGGGMQRLDWSGGGAGPWQWQLRWPGRLQVRIGEAEAAPWGMVLSGWPWRWQADLAGGDLRWLQAPGSALLGACSSWRPGVSPWASPGCRWIVKRRPGCRASSSAPASIAWNCA